MNNIVLIILFIIGVIIAYVLGRSYPGHAIGSINITDSDDPNLQGKVTFIFDEEIEELIKHKTVMLLVHNNLSIKYNHDNEEH